MSSAANGAHDRYRARVMRRGFSTSLIQRGVGAIVPLASVPLALHHLGREDFGVWATAVALTTLFVYADLGVGSGLMTRVGGRAEEGRPADDAREAVSSAYAVVGAVVAALLALLTVLAASGLLGSAIRGSGQAHVGLILYLTLAAFVLNVLVSLVVRVQYAVGQQAASNLWQTLGSLLMLAGMFATSRLTHGPGYFVAASVFAPVVIGLANSVVFYGFDPVGRALIPAVQLAHLGAVKSLLGLGSKFMAVSILLALGVAFDPWIVAHSVALSDVAEYTVPQRLFAVAGLLSVSALMPLWTLQAQAVAGGDVAWVVRTTRRVTLWTTAAMAALVVIVVTIAPWLVHVWLHGEIGVDRWLWAGLGLMCVAQAFVGPMFMVQNGAEILRPQLIGYAVFLVAIPLKLVVAAHTGFQWIPWINVGCYVAFIAPAAAVGYRSSLHLARTRALVGAA